MSERGRAEERGRTGSAGGRAGEAIPNRLKRRGKGGGGGAKGAGGLGLSKPRRGLMGRGGGEGRVAEDTSLLSISDIFSFSIGGVDFTWTKKNRRSARC